MTRYSSILMLFLIIGCTSLILSCSVRESVPVQPNLSQIASHTFIEITLEGGGFYGGINPVTENKKTIKTDGTIVISQGQLYTGHQEQVFTVTRGDIEALAKFISNLGFFELQDMYDCDESNYECQERKRKYPPAVPLEIDVTIGKTRKRVTVTVYQKEMIDYPDNLDSIANRINEVITQTE